MSGSADPPAIEGYRIVGALGRGAMGSVWHAVDRVGRDVAVKVASRTTRLPDASVERMFRREALVALNLRHPNLVRGLEVGETVDGRAFLAMERVVGETLRHRFHDAGPLPEREILLLGHALASALEHAHSLGLVHRDVKPENVILLPDGQVRLVDLGLVAESGTAEERCGTPGYMSPEAILGHETGPASDLYSLGVTLASAAVGRPYFQGPDAKSILRAHLRKRLVLPERVGDHVLSEGFRAVVERLCRKLPAERYGSAGEARLDFESLLHAERPLGAFLGLARLRPPPRRTRALVIGAGAAAGVAVLFLAASTPGRRESPGPPPASEVPGPLLPPDDDARGDVALRYVEAHPDDLGRGRRLLAEALASSPPSAQRARLQEAATRLETRVRAAADAHLAQQEPLARALAARGDLEGMARLLLQWPEALRETPARAQATRLAESLREEVVGPARKVLDDGAVSVARWERGGDEGLEPARDLVARVDRLLAAAPSLATHVPGLAPLRARAAAQVERLALGRRELETSQALASYLDRAIAHDADGAQAALAAAAGAPDDSLEGARLAGAILSVGREVDRSLAKRLAAVGRRAWAGIVDGRLYVGDVAVAPAPRRVFLPVPPSVAAREPSFDFGDLLAAEPDRERSASWLLVVGSLDAAEALAPAGGAARRLLELTGRRGGGAAPRVEGAWAELGGRTFLLMRAPGGPVPDSPPGGDAVLGAWLEATRPGRRPGGRTGAVSAETARTVAAARTAFFDDRWVVAWSLLEEAVAAAPGDAEVAILRCRTLEALAQPLRTTGVSLLALSEARRAWDLDPGLATASRLVADQCLRFRARHAGDAADALVPLTLAACEEAVRLGQADAEVLAFVGERRLAESRFKEAAPLLRRAAREAPDDPRTALLLARVEDALGDAQQATEALVRARKRLGPAFPPWAQEMLDRLSR